MTKPSLERRLFDQLRAEKGQSILWTRWQVLRDCYETSIKHSLHSAVKISQTLRMCKILRDVNISMDPQRKVASDALLWAARRRNKEVFIAALKCFRSTMFAENNVNTETGHWIYKPFYQWPCTVAQELGHDLYCYLVQDLSRPQQVSRSATRDVELWNDLISTMQETALWR